MGEGEKELARVVLMADAFVRSKFFFCSSSLDLPERIFVLLNSNNNLTWESYKETNSMEIVTYFEVQVSESIFTPKGRVGSLSLVDDNLYITPTLATVRHLLNFIAYIQIDI